MTRKMKPVIDRIMARVIVDPETGCWIFTGYLNHFGYGMTRVTRKTRLTHRVMFEEAGGVLVDGMQLDHLCAVPACCRPNHLEQVTPKENVHRSRNVKSRTHCPQGHRFTPDNLVRSNKARQCRTCKNAIAARYRADNRVKINTIAVERRASNRANINATQNERRAKEKTS